MKEEQDDVAMQGIEFWSNVCEEELNLAAETEEQFSSFTHVVLSLSWPSKTQQLGPLVESVILVKSWLRGRDSECSSTCSLYGSSGSAASSRQCLLGDFEFGEGVLSSCFGTGHRHAWPASHLYSSNVFENMIQELIKTTDRTDASNSNLQNYHGHSCSGICSHSCVLLCKSVLNKIKKEDAPKISDAIMAGLLQIMRRCFGKDGGAVIEEALMAVTS
uniref:Uncharacterized protein n=1 Tax=Ditylenchus dipsaci TaxID=166011 RepID=A0A915EKG4_9BILA